MLLVLLVIRVLPSEGRYFPTNYSIERSESQQKLKKEKEKETKGKYSMMYLRRGRHREIEDWDICEQILHIRGGRLFSIFMKYR